MESVDNINGEAKPPRAERSGSPSRIIRVRPRRFRQLQKTGQTEFFDDVNPWLPGEITKVVNLWYPNGFSILTEVTEIKTRRRHKIFLKAVSE